MPHSAINKSRPRVSAAVLLLLLPGVAGEWVLLEQLAKLRLVRFAEQTPYHHPTGGDSEPVVRASGAKVFLGFPGAHVGASGTYDLHLAVHLGVRVSREYGASVSDPHELSSLECLHLIFLERPEAVEDFVAVEVLLGVVEYSDGTDFKRRGLQSTSPVAVWRGG